MPKRSHIGPFFGWLSAELPLYPSTENLKARVHLRDNGVRPYVELEPTEHPLAIEQRNGITVDRVAEIYAHCVHSKGCHVRRCTNNKKRRLPRETAFCLIMTRKEEVSLSLAGLAATYSPRA